MALRRLEIKMATLIEEEFHNEEHDVRAETFYLKDDDEENEEEYKRRDKEQLKEDIVLVNHVNSRVGFQEEQIQTPNIGTDDEDDGSRRGSLVEREVPSDLDGAIIDSVVRGSQPSESLTRLEAKEPSMRGPKKQSRLPKATSPTSSSSTSPFTFPPGGTQTKTTSSYTLFVKDKYVTELFFHSPHQGSRRWGFGLFLSTSRLTGDHTVYKISPLSPLAQLRLQAQDRITKINGFNVGCWSHNAVVNFVAALPNFDQIRCVSHRKAFPFTFSLEYISVQCPLRSPDSGQRYFEVVLEIIIHPNGRSTIGATTVRQSRIAYINMNGCIRLGVAYLPGNYIQVAEEDTGAATPVLRVQIGERTLEKESAVKFTMHKFDYVGDGSSWGESGDVVALETLVPNTFLQAGSSEAGASLSVVNVSDIRTTSHDDPKLFRLFVDPTDGARYRIRNIASGRYLRANDTTVSLADIPIGPFPESMLFEKQDCTAN